MDVQIIANLRILKAESTDALDKAVLIYATCMGAVQLGYVSYNETEANLAH